MSTSNEVQPDFHSQLLPTLRKEEGFLSAQEVIPYYGLYIGGNILTRTPSIISKFTGILSVNGEIPQLLHNVSNDQKFPLKIQNHNIHLNQVLVLALDDHTSQTLFPYLRITYEFIQHHRLRYWYSPYLSLDQSNTTTLPSSTRKPTVNSTYTLPSPDARGGILVHCTLGISRSSAIVIAYIMMHSKITVSMACKIVQRARPWIRPNDGFLYQLYHLEYLLGLSILPVNPLPLSSSNTSFVYLSKDIETEFVKFPLTIEDVWNSNNYPVNTYGHTYIYMDDNNVLRTHRFNNSFQLPSNISSSTTTITNDNNTIFSSTFSHKPHNVACTLCVLHRLTHWYGIDWNTFEETYLNQLSTVSSTTIFQLPLSNNTIPKLNSNFQINNHPALVIMDCDTCHIPMIVLRIHLSNWKQTPSIIYQDMQQCLLSVINSYNINERTNHSASLSTNPSHTVYPYIDEQQRSIPDHAHAHLRTLQLPLSTNNNKLIHTSTVSSLPLLQSKL